MKIIRPIAVVGATGTFGNYTTRTLANEGYSVTAVVRNMLKGQKMLGSKIHLHKADLQDAGSLLTAFRDVDYVYLNLSTAPDEKEADFKTEIDGVKNVLKAAKQAKIKRVGFLSSLVKDYDGTGWWVFDIKREAVRILLESDIPVTIFYSSNFFENLTELQKSGNKILLAGRQKTKSWWISSEDYGKQVAAAFHQEHDENREYSVQGPEPFSMDEAADIFIEKFSGKKLKKVRAPMWLFKPLTAFSNKIDFQYQIVNAINKYDEQFQSEKTWEELGKPQITLREWAAEQ